MSLVIMLSPAVSFGVFGLSLFPAFAFFGFVGAFDLGLVVTSGLLEGAKCRPLRVYRSCSASSIADMGVGGELENIV
jgi:hypothetical protein